MIYLVSVLQAESFTTTVNTACVSEVCFPSAPFLISKTNIAAVVTRHLVLFWEMIQWNGTDAHRWNNFDNSIDSRMTRKVMEASLIFWKHPQKCLQTYLSTADALYGQIGQTNCELVMLSKMQFSTLKWMGGTATQWPAYCFKLTETRDKTQLITYHCIFNKYIKKCKSVTKVVTFKLAGNINLCTQFHGTLSSSCGNILSITQNYNVNLMMEKMWNDHQSINRCLQRIDVYEPSRQCIKVVELFQPGPTNQL